MPRVVRLVTLVDIAPHPYPRSTSFSARHEAVLDDGRRVLLLDDRGWSQSPAGLGDAGEIAETARTVVGPDEPFGERSRDDMEADHWNALTAGLRAHGVVAGAAELKRLPHDVVLGEPLLARLGGA
jgi:hypothetical protein